MSEVTAAAILDTIADTLVLQEKYASKDDALRGLAQAAVHTKVERYRRRIQRLRRKYAMDFAAFTHSLEGNADPRAEDDWFAWRSALSMLEEWQSVYASLADAQVR